MRDMVTKMSVGGVAVWYAVSFAVLVAAPMPTEPDVTESELLAARRGIESGYVRIETVTTHPKRESERGMSTLHKTTYECLFHKDSLREVQESSGGDGRLAIRRFESRSDGVRFSGVGGLGPDGSPIVVQSEPTGRVEPQLIDARVFGVSISATPHLHNKTLEMLVVGNRERVSMDTHDDFFAEMPCKRIEYRRKDGAKCRLWLADESLAYSLLRGETEFDHNGQTLVDSIECQIKSWPREDNSEPVFYPSEVTYDRKAPDGHLIHEVATVVEARFGQPIGKKEFGPAGFPLLPGTVIADSSPGVKRETKMWDGQKLVPFQPRVTLPNEPPLQPRKGWKSIVTWNLIALGVLCIWIWWLRRKQQ